MSENNHEDDAGVDGEAPIDHVADEDIGGSESGLRAGEPFSVRVKPVEKPPSRIGRIMRDKSSRNMLLFFGAVAAVGVGYTAMPHRAAKTASSLEPSPTVSAVQGSAPPSQQYAQALQSSDAQRQQQAAATGGSAVPTIVDNAPVPSPSVSPDMPSAPGAQPATPPPPPALPDGSGDTGQQAATPTVTPSQGAAPPQHVNAPNVVVTQSDRVQAISQYMAGLSNQPTVAQQYILATQPNTANPAGFGGVAGMQPVDGVASQQVVNAAATTLAAQPAASQQQAAPQPFKNPAPGTMLYSQMISGVNSNDPGAVMGEILQGPLAGARIMGGFQTHSDGVTITFTTMTIPYTDSDGNRQVEVLPINAVAVSADNLNNSMATSINNHIALRLGVAFVSAMAGNFGNLLQQSGATTVLNSTGSIATSNPQLSTQNELLSAAGQSVGSAGQILDQEYGNLPPTIKVAAGTPFVLLFTGSAGK